MMERKKEANLSDALRISQEVKAAEQIIEVADRWDMMDRTLGEIIIELDRKVRLLDRALSKVTGGELSLERIERLMNSGTTTERR